MTGMSRARVASTANPGDRSMSGSASDDVFPRIWAVTAGFEGSTLDLTYGDRGNWRTGRVGIGVLAGSKFGVSAASYPDVDIAALTYSAAMEIARRDFWTAVRGSEMHPALALHVFDSAFNNGAGNAAKLLQAALGVTIDGVIGPRTLAAAAAWKDVALLCADFLAQRIAFTAEMPEWIDDAHGFAARLARIAFASIPFLTAATR
jgi:lysozyme family protein